MFSVPRATSHANRLLSSARSKSAASLATGWIESSQPLDFHRIRTWLASAYEALDTAPLTEQKTTEMLQELKKFAHVNLFKSEVFDLVRQIVDLRVRQLSVLDLISALGIQIRIDEAGNGRDTTKMVLAELSSEARLDALGSLRSWREWLDCLQLVAQVNCPNADIVRTCAENLSWSLGSMSAIDISLALSSMCKLEAKHSRLEENIIHILPVIPCSDQELDAIVSYLLVLKAGSEEDRKFLTDLVRFRKASLLE